MSSKANLSLFDILGYSGWMMNADELLSKKVEMLKKLDGALSAMIKYWKNSIEINHHNYADNILLWTPDESEGGLEYLLFVTSFVFSFLLHAGLPLRGAVNHGEVYFSHDEGIYTGPALVEAHQCQDLQRWLGVVICDSVKKKYGEPFLKKSTLLAEEDISFKSNSGEVIRRIWCLDWPRIEAAVPQSYQNHLCNVDDLRFLEGNAGALDKDKYSRTIDFFVKRTAT